jgi:hypothetical protein
METMFNLSPLRACRSITLFVCSAMGLAGRSWNSTSHVVRAAGSVLLRLMGNTATSWRNTSSSASFAAPFRGSRASHRSTRHNSRYSSRRSCADHRGPATPVANWQVSTHDRPSGTHTVKADCGRGAGRGRRVLMWGVLPLERDHGECSSARAMRSNGAGQKTCQGLRTLTPSACGQLRFRAAIPERREQRAASTCRFRLQGRHLIVVVAKPTQDGAGMLADRWDRLHPRFTAGDGNRRQ